MGSDETEEELESVLLDDTDEEAIARVLEEQGLSAERALRVLIATIVNRHIDCTLRKLGRRPAFSPGNERINALTAVIDSLYEAMHVNNQMNAELGSDEAAKDPTIDLETYEDALEAGDVSKIQQALIQILGCCQMVRERDVGMNDDEDEGQTRMRLVTD